MLEWYQKKTKKKTTSSLIVESSAFGTDPFGGSELSDKTRVSPFGNAGGDTHTGLLEPSDSKSHANNYFSSDETPSTEKALEELKKSIERKRRKKRLNKKYAASKFVAVGEDHSQESSEKALNFILKTNPDVVFCEFIYDNIYTPEQCRDKIKNEDYDKNLDIDWIRACAEGDFLLYGCDLPENNEKIIDSRYRENHMLSVIKKFINENSDYKCCLICGCDHILDNDSVLNIWMKENNFPIYCSRKNEEIKKYAQWGSGSSEISGWDHETGDDWVTKTYKNITSDDNKNTTNNRDKQSIPNILNSTVMVEMTKGKDMETGSGFFLSENIILTCAHVVIPEDGIQDSSIKVITNSGSFLGYVWAYDLALDVAAVVVNDKNFKGGIALNLGNSNQLDIGDQILVVGSPLGFQNIVTQGIVSSQPVDYKEGDKQFNYIFISSNIYPGNSGGPVVSEKNNSVIGIAAAVITPDQQAQNGLSATIPMDTIKPFLKQNGIKFKFEG